MESAYSIHLKISKVENGQYLAESDDIPGLVAQGRSPPDFEPAFSNFSGSGLALLDYFSYYLPGRAAAEGCDQACKTGTASPGFGSCISQLDIV